MKIALHTRVRADRIEDYEQAQRQVPGELTEAIRAAGVAAGRSGAAGLTCSISSTAPTTARLLAAWQSIPVNAAWQARMAELLETVARLLSRRRRRRACRWSGSCEHHRRASPCLGPGRARSGLDQRPDMAAIRRSFSVDDLRPAAQAAGVTGHCRRPDSDGRGRDTGAARRWQPPTRWWPASSAGLT